MCVVCTRVCHIGWIIYLHSEGYQAFQQSVTGDLSAPLRGQRSSMSWARCVASVCSVNPCVVFYSLDGRLQGVV